MKGIRVLRNGALAFALSAGIATEAFALCKVVDEQPAMYTRRVSPLACSQARTPRNPVFGIILDTCQASALQLGLGIGAWLIPVVTASAQAADCDPDTGLLTFTCGLPACRTGDSIIGGQSQQPQDSSVGRSVGPARGTAEL